MLGRLPTEIRALLACMSALPAIFTLTSTAALIDSTLEDVRISMPLFLKITSSLLETSRDWVGTSLSVSSIIVTLTPRVLKRFANSHPMTPPPMITMLAGSSLISRTPSLDRIYFSSILIPASDMHPEPLAIIMDLALTDSDPLILTMSPPASVALPLIRSILFALKSVSIPVLRRNVTSSLRATIAGKSTLKPSTITPQAADPLRVDKIEAEFRKDFVGIHPRLRHVPPTRSFSITQTLRLWREAYSAAT